MTCVGLRLKENLSFRVDADMKVFLHARRIPHRVAFKVPKPWWVVDIMTTEGRHDSVTLWEGDEKEIEIPPGIYWIGLGGLVKATPHELNIHCALLQYGLGKEQYPFRGSRMACSESDELEKGTTRVTGRSLNLVGLRTAFLHFQPTEVVKGAGQAEVTLEHSDDGKSWEPHPSGGFPGKRIIIDQAKPQSFREQMAFGGIKQYVRWVYFPTDVLGWGMRGRFFYETDSLSRR